MTAPVRRALPAASVTALADRAGADRSARRSRRLRRVGGGLLLAAPVCGLGWVLWSSTWFAVDRVQVLGHGRVTASEVQQAAAVAPGSPLARVDTGAVERRIGRLAPVASVEVTRSWPGTLRVEVTERAPVAGVVVGSGVQMVDASGVLFGQERSLPAGVVRLQVPAPGPDDPTTRAALAVHRDLPAPLRERVAVVRASTPSSVELLTADGKQVVWGSPGGTATKGAAALVLLRTDSQVVDVSAPGVVVRRSSASPEPKG